MNELSSNLSAIQNYTQAKTLLTDGKISKEQFKIAKDSAKVALKNLHHLLSHGDLNKSLSKESLEQVKKITYEHITSSPSKQNRIAKLAQGIIEKKLDTTCQVFFLADALIEKDEVSRQMQISQALHSWRAVPEAQVKDLLRSFAMQLAKGNTSARPASIFTVLKEIRVELLEQILTKSPGSTAKTILALLDDPDLFSSLELKTGTLRPTAAGKIEEHIAERVSGTEHTIVEKEPVETVVSRLREQRQFCLHNLQSVYKKVSADPEQRVNAKFFPLTHSWYVGSNRTTQEAPFERTMQRIGEEHGITVITDSLESSISDASNTLVLDNPRVSVWAQDFVDFTKEEVHVPLMRDETVNYGKLFSESIFKSRVERHTAWTKPDPFLYLAVGTVNNIWESQDSLKAIALASALGVEPIMNLTYSEGGNTLLGNHPDGTPYVIIGKDTFAVSKALLERDLGRAMTDTEVKMAFAIDYGVRIENLHFIEQPGDFHLDMNMAIVGPDTIAVNDSQKCAVEFQGELEEWLQGLLVEVPPEKHQIVIEKTTRQAHALAEKKKVFEDIAAADLERQGFKVIRVAGRYSYKTPDGPEVPVMNFYNMVTAKAPDGKNIVVAMGIIDTKYSEQFKSMMQQGGSDYDEVHFLSYGWTRQSLAKHGGISCRTKTM